MFLLCRQKVSVTLQRFHFNTVFILFQKLTGFRPKNVIREGIKEKLVLTFNKETTEAAELI